MKIISGGQVGADIAGLRAGKKLGFETGGWMPKGFKTLDGFHPEYAELYGCKESSDGGYPQRTRLNVLMSEMTLRFAIDFNSPGERLTLKCIQQMQRPHMDIPINNPHGFYGCRDYLYKEVPEFVNHHNIKIINVAGNANKEIEPFVEGFLIQVFS